MSSTDLFELFGQAPAVSNNSVFNIMNFLGASADDVPANYTANWFDTYENISGFTMTPLGRRHSGQEGSNGQKWFGYKIECGLRLQDYPSGQILFNMSQGITIYSNLYHLCQARYARAKTDEELGYKMYVDSCRNAVVMLPFSQVTELTELPRGLERGIALRYANRNQMKVLRAWSEIRTEANAIRQAIPTIPSMTPLSYVCNGDPAGCITVKFRDSQTDALLNGHVELRNSDDVFIGIYELLDGEVSIPVYDSGAYTIAEVTPPAGYQSITTPYTVTVSSSESCAIVNYSYVYASIPPSELPDTVSLLYTKSAGSQVDNANAQGWGEVDIEVSYTGTRIGEYYWMNQNFNHREPIIWQWATRRAGEEGEFPLTRGQIDTYLDDRIFVPSSQFQVNGTLVDPSLMEEYYGKYYTRETASHMILYGKMYENGVLNPQWNCPTTDDFKQLFAMSDVRNSDGILREQHVRMDMSPLPYENPLAFNMSNPNNSSYQIYWFTSMNTNMYNYNMMPGGYRLAVNEGWNNSLEKVVGLDAWPGVKGDLAQTFYTYKSWVVGKDAQGNILFNDPYNNSAYRVVSDLGNLDMNDWIEFPGQGYKWFNMRWSRKLTDEELGYKLYMNADSTDIQKLAPNQMPASGYSELPNGYLRGFYVQYILDNPSPERTVGDIAYMSRVTECFNSKGVEDNPDSICFYCGICPEELQTRRGKAENAGTRLEDISGNGAKALSVYPNPVDDVLNIDSESPVVSVKVYSSTGSLVKRMDDVGKSLDTSILPPGIYTFVIQTEKENATFRIVKK
jgi:hypothetical protein